MYAYIYMLAYTYMYKNHSSNSGYVRWACGHGLKCKLTIFSAPLGILETQELPWAQVKSSGSPYSTASILHLLQGESGKVLHPLPDSVSKHTMQAKSEIKSSPFLNVLNSITKTTLLSCFHITTANQGAARVPHVPVWYKCPRGTQTQLCFPELWNATVSFMETATKCPFNMKDWSQAESELSGFYLTHWIVTSISTRLRKGGSTSVFPLICWITDDHWTVAGYWGRKSTTCREAGEEAP